MKFKLNKNLTETLINLPSSSGCYLYRDKKGKIIYVGKAKNIKKRVSSYFQNFKKHDVKIQVLISQVAKIEFIKTENEIEALILETNLIKKYLPKFNKLMKDDKNYCFIRFTVNEDFPRIEIVRDEKGSGIFCGPFTNKHLIETILRNLRKIFPYRSCNRKIKILKKNADTDFYSQNSKPCLFYRIHLCNAPCANLVKKISYRKNVFNILKFFKKGKLNLILQLKKELEQKKRDLAFEDAAMIRDQITQLEFISQRVLVESKMDEFDYIETKLEKNKKLIENLLKKIRLNLKVGEKFKIECYDISNLSGKNATGSMVVFENGEANKNLYRRFRIKSKTTPDDYSMLSEVIQRRINNLNSSDESFSKKPDLMIIDGGKGQLSSVLSVLKKNKLIIPCISIAKRLDHLFIFKNETFHEISLGKNSEVLFLIQKIRDEAHRFAIKYHKQLRSKNFIKKKE